MLMHQRGGVLAILMWMLLPRMYKDIMAVLQEVCLHCTNSVESMDGTRVLELL